MIRLLKRKAKQVLYYRPIPGDGPFKTFRYLLFDFTVCLTPDAVRAVMARHYKIFQKGIIMRELLDSILGPSLFTLDGPQWKSRRSCFNQWFNENVSDSTLHDFRIRLNQKLDSLSLNEGINIAAWNRDLVTETFCVGMLGLPKDKIVALKRYHTVEDVFFIRALFRLFRAYGLKRLFFIRQIFELQNSARKTVIASDETSDSAGYVAYLQDKLEKGLISQDDAQSEIMSNYSSALTTAYSLSMLAMHLVEHPELLSDNEIDDNRAMSICMESTRITPTTYVLFRQADEDIEIDGCPMKKGRHIIIPIETIQRNEEFWKDAQKFCPHRFQNMEKSDVNNAPWFSFGVGSRQCPGKTLALKMMTIYLQEMAARKIRLMPGKQWPPEFDRGLVLEPKNNEMWVTVGRA